MSYESWRISFQSCEQAAKAAYKQAQTLKTENERLRGELGKNQLHEIENGFINASKKHGW